MREVFALYLHFIHKIDVFGLLRLHSFSESIFLLFSQFSCNFSTQKAARMDEWDRVFKISSWGRIYEPQFMWFTFGSCSVDIIGKIKQGVNSNCRPLLLLILRYEVTGVHSVLRRVQGLALVLGNASDFILPQYQSHLTNIQMGKIRKRVFDGICPLFDC